jgi:ketosteroid isomerase-like protein
MPPGRRDPTNPESFHQPGQPGDAALTSALGQQFSNCLSYENEIVAAQARGDLAYTVALERVTASISGGEPEPYVLRVTTIFRRDHGEWKVVHRHGDALAADSGAVVGGLTTSGRPVSGGTE